MNKRIHILGVAGTLMGSFAAFLKQSGIHVTGSDQNIYPPMSDVLKNAGVPIFSPFAAENINQAKPDLVIVGNVIRKTNPEMQAVLEKNLTYLSLPHALETIILPKKHSIVIAGTHGKTTATSILAWLMECLNENPSFCIGGVTHNFKESFRITNSKYMILEGDEYDTAFFDKVPKFTHYLPKDVILTSVEFDHADIYADIRAVVSAFDLLASQIPRDGYFVVYGETETPLRVAHGSNAKVITYGFSNSVDSKASHIEFLKDACKFRWHFSGTHRVSMKLTGNHNILNAVACLTLLHARGFDIEKAIDALSQFQGVKRRQEVFSQILGITLIDDFAHHPTAVRETLSAIRSKYSTSRIIACFEPRSATSRMQVFQQAYAEAFDSADLIYIAKPYAPPSARDELSNKVPAPSPSTFSSEDLVRALQYKGKRTKLLLTTNNGISALASDLRSGDVVVVMSNGSFDGLLSKLTQLLSK